MNDGEIDLDLIDPAGMNRGVDEKGIGPMGSNAFDSFLTAMSRAVVHDPKNALGGFVGFATHDVGDETIGGSNPVLLFTMSEDLGTMDVPSG